MFKKIQAWWARRKNVTGLTPPELTQEDTMVGLYTYEQVENAYLLGYNDGKVEGLSIARVQATKSLKEILWRQNNPSQK